MTKTKRLGDLLVEAGFVTRLQIDQALQAQQIFGDRLGTNLIEMGAIDGETLAGFLSQQFGVPRVTYEEMEKIPRDVLDVVPAKAAHRLCMLPIAKLKDRLVVAMIDPSDAHILKRVEENLGVKVEQRVATEVEVRYYLEKYYGIRREMRHIRLMNKLIEKRTARDLASAETDILTSQLDRYINADEATRVFFNDVRDLTKIPVRQDVGDLTKYDITPELTFLFLQIDGLSNLHDLFSASPFPRITTLRALVYLSKLGLVRFDEP